MDNDDEGLTLSSRISKSDGALFSTNDIPRTNIFGHDFAPGYSRPGGTSCPDRLFGAVHSQATVAAWVEANV